MCVALRCHIGSFPNQCEPINRSWAPLNVADAHVPPFVLELCNIIDFFLFGLFFFGRHMGAKDNPFEKQCGEFVRGSLYSYTFFVFFYHRLVRLLFRSSPFNKASSPSTPLNSSSGSRALFLEDTGTGGGGGGRGGAVSAAACICAGPHRGTFPP